MTAQGICFGLTLQPCTTSALFHSSSTYTVEQPDNEIRIHGELHTSFISESVKRVVQQGTRSRGLGREARSPRSRTTLRSRSASSRRTPATSRARAV